MTEIVIKIPEEVFNEIVSADDASHLSRAFLRGSYLYLKEALQNGTPLPKGHKRLIEDNFEVGPVFDEVGNRVGYQYVTQEGLNNAPTIIEADKAESEG